MGDGKQQAELRIDSCIWVVKTHRIISVIVVVGLFVLIYYIFWSSKTEDRKEYTILVLRI